MRHWVEFTCDNTLMPLAFLRVPGRKKAKNRLHIDLNPSDQQAEVQRLLALGATRTGIGQGDARWVVMADPEGNEFCVLAARTATGRTAYSCRSEGPNGRKLRRKANARLVTMKRSPGVLLVSGGGG
jgi:hypothetical protein